MCVSRPLEENAEGSEGLGGVADKAAYTVHTSSSSSVALQPGSDPLTGFRDGYECTI
jgi:hypothetical protein